MCHKSTNNSFVYHRLKNHPQNTQKSTQTGITLQTKATANNHFDVRHEVTIALVTTEKKRDVTCCSTNSILPEHASRGRGVKLQGQSSLSQAAGHQPARGGGDCQHQSARERGWGGMVNICESLLNAVRLNKPKVLGLGQKARGQV
jgi:hypothetical protein